MQRRIRFTTDLKHKSMDQVVGLRFDSQMSSWIAIPSTFDCRLSWVSWFYMTCIALALVHANIRSFPLPMLKAFSPRPNLDSDQVALAHLLASRQ